MIRTESSSVATTGLRRFFKVLDTLKAPDEVFATVIFYSTGYFDGWW